MHRVEWATAGVLAGRDPGEVLADNVRNIFIVHRSYCDRWNRTEQSVGQTRSLEMI